MSSIGRPPKNKQKQHFSDKALYKFLASRLPERFVKEDGSLATNLLAKEGEVVRFTVYRWLNNNRLSSSSAKIIINISEGKIKDTDLLPFLLG